MSTFQELMLQIDADLQKEISPEELDFLFSSLDITNLNSAITIDSLQNLFDKVANIQNTFHGISMPAAVCIYSVWGSMACQVLKGKGVNVVCVGAGFPHGQMTSVAKLRDILEICKLDIDEIDVVINVPYFLSGEFEKISDEISAMKDIMGSNKLLKVILETQFLKPKEVFDASTLVLEAGADFIKTSTGKEGSEASPEGFYQMCCAIKEYHQHTGKMCGIKAAGGISVVHQARVYRQIVKYVLGDAWLKPSCFRIGASRLANDILNKLAPHTGWDTKFLPYF